MVAHKLTNVMDDVVVVENLIARLDVDDETKLQADDKLTTWIDRIIEIRSDANIIIAM